MSGFTFLLPETTTAARFGLLCNCETESLFSSALIHFSFTPCACSHRTGWRGHRVCKSYPCTPCSTHCPHQTRFVLFIPRSPMPPLKHGVHDCRCWCALILNTVFSPSAFFFLFVNTHVRRRRQQNNSPGRVSGSRSWHEAS
jgi:hypothetical protein